MDQRIMYLVTATHYLTGIAPGILLLVPALEVFFDLRPVNLTISWETWLLFYAGFYVLQVLLAFYTLGSFRWEVLMLAAVSFPIYISAFYNALTKKEQKWHVTGSTSKVQSPFNFMIPQVLVFFFLAFTSVISIWRDLGNSQLSLATAWCVTNTFILFAFILVAFKESWHNKHPRASVPDPIAGITAAEDQDTSHEALTMIGRPRLEAQALANAGSTEKSNNTTPVLEPAEALDDEKKEVYAK
jgi:cellulose synthase (UDP-forming)